MILFHFVLSPPPEDVLSVELVGPSQGAVQPVKEVRVESKVAVEVPDRVDVCVCVCVCVRARACVCVCIGKAWSQKEPGLTCL